MALAGGFSLATASASPRQRRVALAVCGLLIVITAAVLPHSTAQLPVIPAFLPTFAAAVFILDVLTAFLLFSQFATGRSVSLALLAATYLFSGLIVVVQIGTFPGVYTAAGLFGAGTQTAVWLWMFWHAGFPLGILTYAIADWRSDAIVEVGRTTRILASLVTAVVVLVLFLAVLTTRFGAFLPPLVAHGNYAAAFHYGVAQFVLVAAAAAPLALLKGSRTTAVSHVWLVVAATALLADCVLTLFGGARFTLGWYLARFDSVIVSATILIVFLFEIHVLYRRLARAASVAAFRGLILAQPAMSSVRPTRRYTLPRMRDEIALWPIRFRRERNTISARSDHRCPRLQPRACRLPHRCALPVVPDRRFPGSSRAR